MADFCSQCSIEHFGKDFGDLANLCGNGEVAQVICEGCGLIWVDHDGARIEAAPTHAGQLSAADYDQLAERQMTLSALERGFPVV